MNRTYKFVKKSGTVKCSLPTGDVVKLPVIQGILKHPSAENLHSILKNPDAAKKYTIEAIRKASWPVLRQFPKSWLIKCYPEAKVPGNRRAALEFLLNINTD